MKKISVIIPALNEEEAIGKVIKDIPEHVNEIIVVDNGSTDNTAKISREAGARVVFEKRKGYGYACLAGISAVKDPDIVVFLDGDYSDYPEDIDLLINPIIEEGYDFVVGSRIKRLEEGAMPFYAIFANLFFGFLIKLFYGVKFTDLGPFRAIKYDRLLELDMQDKTYGWTVEMQIKAIKKNFKIKEVDVRYKRRLGKSKITGSLTVSVKAAIKICWMIVNWRRWKT